MPDVVYLVRPGEPNDKLRYSLRSLANVPHERVWIAGYMPEWVRGVEHIAVREEPGAKYANLPRAMRAVCAHAGVAERFVYFNDDMFVTEAVDTVPVWHRGAIADQLAPEFERLRRAPQRQVPEHKRGGMDALGFLRGLGYSDPLSYELHVPLPVDKQAMAEALALAGPVAGSYQRSLYGNLAGIGGEQAPDVKVHSRTEPLPTGLFVSTCPASWRGATGERLRSMFATPGPYECPTRPAARVVAA